LTEDKQKPVKIRNDLVNDIYESVRLVFSNKIKEYKDVTFEEMDIVMYRLTEGLFQSKVAMMMAWQNDENKKAPADVYK
jgi:hypothetical protein